jgi:hypothetical protein
LNDELAHCGCAVAGRDRKDLCLKVQALEEPFQLLSLLDTTSQSVRVTFIQQHCLDIGILRLRYRVLGLLLGMLFSIVVLE